MEEKNVSLFIYLFGKRKINYIQLKTVKKSGGC